MGRTKILEMRDLNVSFRTSQGSIEAIRGVNLDLYKAETLAIVGESGSGKSVTVKTIMGILANNQRINSGVIDYKYEQNGQMTSVDLLKISKKEMRRTFNGKRIAMVFQDPMTSLNPTMTIGAQIMEGMFIHYKTGKKEARQKALSLLELVGITNGEERIDQYPHQLSGGMRQRVVIAIALACDPEILICDEPTTALDVTIQAKILELIKAIQEKTGIAVIYITHDLGVVSKVADYVNVMYAGRIVERGTVDDIFYNPKHPYTWGLLSAMPDVNTTSDKLYAIPGNPPNLAHHKQGDPFYVRNVYALNIDKRLDPPVFQVSDTHYVASWLMHENAPVIDMPSELKGRINRMKLEANQYDGL
ncbi:ABC transporter ATP-binding protein [Fundicoccus sp. Sow4_D5]|uniref:ABC transporter ATP-binding protein n=1 Tax=unclassified Fundicoccus TaxID=2761543 RepID=UPI003F9046FC